MISKKLLLIVFTALISLMGCSGESSESSETVIVVSEPDPELRQFDMVDTYGTNSEFEPVSNLAVSPFIQGGEFELFWNIHSHFDYYVDFRINTSPTLSGSQLVFSDYCDSLFSCHDYQYLYCDYQSDFDIVCENYLGETQVAYIGDYIERIPQTLYFILDTCDGHGLNCTYQAIPVVME